jgi:hypothetical protein
MQRQGRSALEKTLAGVGGKLPRSNLGYLAELLLSFSKRMPNETRVWLKELFALVRSASSCIAIIPSIRARADARSLLPGRLSIEAGVTRAERPLCKSSDEVRNCFAD